MKILVAEDDPISRKILEKLLSKWGHEVQLVTNGVQAWELFRKEQFSIVITDWMMPEMDGIELIKRIRENISDYYVYIIILTAKTLREDSIEGFEAGADDYLTKPIDKRELQARLRTAERVLNLEKNLAEQNKALTQINQRIQKELEAAVKIQNTLLPHKLPEVPDLKIAWKFRPCTELAGDLLNVFSLDGEHIGFYILDVSGHGVAASLLSVALSHFLSPTFKLSSMVRQGTGDASGFRINSPAKVLTQLNNEFQMDKYREQFFTVIYGIMECHSKKITFSSAGHTPPIWLSNNKSVRFLMESDLPAGVIPDKEYQDFTIEPQPGDRLLLYSDGVIEVRNQNEELFGQKRLKQLLLDTVQETPEATLEIIMGAVEKWSHPLPIHDDVTLLLFEFE